MLKGLVNTVDLLTLAMQAIPCAEQMPLREPWMA